MNQFVMTFLVVSGLFLGGFLFTTGFSSYSNRFHHLCAAFPVGCGLWGIVWIATNFIMQLVGEGLNDETTTIALYIYRAHIRPVLDHVLT